MLDFIFSARHPDFVDKLILVGSAVYEEHYAAGIEAKRLSRLSEDERREVRLLLAALDDPAVRDRNTVLARLGHLFAKTDAYDAVAHDTEILEVHGGLYQRPWQEATQLRANGDLLKLGRRIRCPVVAIHGGYDPHPLTGSLSPCPPCSRTSGSCCWSTAGTCPGSSGERGKSSCASSETSYDKRVRRSRRANDPRWAVRPPHLWGCGPRLALVRRQAERRSVPLPSARLRRKARCMKRKHPFLKSAGHARRHHAVSRTSTRAKLLPLSPEEPPETEK